MHHQYIVSLNVCTDTIGGGEALPIQNCILQEEEEERNSQFAHQVAPFSNTNMTMQSRWSCSHPSALWKLCKWQMSLTLLHIDRRK